MKLKNKKIGLCVPEILPNNKELLNFVKLQKDALFFPIVDNFNVINNEKEYYDERFLKKLQQLTNQEIIHTEFDAEIIGKLNYFDIIIILPCTENIIPKLSFNIFDSPTMKIVKYQLINNKPVVLCIYANNGLSENAESIGKLLNQKNYYFVPFKQANPITKPYLISFDFSYILNTLEAALDKKQVQPIIISI